MLSMWQKDYEERLINSERKSRCEKMKKVKLEWTEGIIFRKKFTISLDKKEYEKIVWEHRQKDLTDALMNTIPTLVGVGIVSSALRKFNAKKGVKR